MCEGMFPRYMRELYVCLRLGQSRSTRKNSTVKPCPCAVAGAMLTRWCHSASVIVDPRRASAAWVPWSVTRDFPLNSTRADARRCHHRGDLCGVVDPGQAALAHGCSMLW